MIAFWILAPIMVVAALGMLFVRKAVHCALLLAVVMISLAVLYAVQDAPFLFAVQIIVYTGAILMLFLFVLMLVGVDASDSVVETIRGQRLLADARRPALRRDPRDRRRPGLRRRGRSASTRPTRTATSRQLAQLLFTQVRLRLRGHLGAADHRRARRDGARPPRAAHAEGRPRPTAAAAADARLRRPRQAPRPAAAARVSSPGTTPSTPRRCCPTAPPSRPRSRGCSPPAARSSRPRAAPTTSTRCERQIGGTTTRPCPPPRRLHRRGRAGR